MIKKRVLALFLTFVMVFSMVPMVVSASEPPVSLTSDEKRAELEAMVEGIVVARLERGGFLSDAAGEIENFYERAQEAIRNMVAGAVGEAVEGMLDLYNPELNAAIIEFIGPLVTAAINGMLSTLPIDVPGLDAESVTRIMNIMFNNDIVNAIITDDLFIEIVRQVAEYTVEDLVELILADILPGLEITAPPSNAAQIAALVQEYADYVQNRLVNQNTLLNTRGIDTGTFISPGVFYGRRFETVNVHWVLVPYSVQEPFRNPNPAWTQWNTRHNNLVDSMNTAQVNHDNAYAAMINARGSYLEATVARDEARAAWEADGSPTVNTGNFIRPVWTPSGPYGELYNAAVAAFNAARTAYTNARNAVNDTPGLFGSTTLGTATRLANAIAAVETSIDNEPATHLYGYNTIWNFAVTGWQNESSSITAIPVVSTMTAAIEAQMALRDLGTIFGGAGDTIEDIIRIVNTDFNIEDYTDQIPALIARNIPRAVVTVLTRHIQELISNIENMVRDAVVQLINEYLGGFLGGIGLDPGVNLLDIPAVLLAESIRFMNERIEGLPAEEMEAMLEYLLNGDFPEFLGAAMEGAATVVRNTVINPALDAWNSVTEWVEENIVPGVTEAIESAVEFVEEVVTTINNIINNIRLPIFPRFR